ncbi:hypothetical protein FAVG1_02884 [Fusarium avenaceum]|nr:hypothetical protein FAVG1_02884 [Fusarium avenaceum]
MPSNDNSASIRPTARRKDPACGTCRKKCRKCDRKRPICDRCRTKGLHCEGYPPRFQFQETLIVSPAQRPQEAPLDTADASPPRVAEEGPLTGSLDVSDTTALGFALQQTALDSSVLALTSPLSSATPTLSPPLESFDSRVVGNSDLENDILTNQHIIDYFDHTLSDHFIIHVQGLDNPFRQYILPLAYQDQGILHALLGLSACHMHNTGNYHGSGLITVSLGYRLSAIRSLATLLAKEETSLLTHIEEEYVLAMVCESGVSTHGAHLTGVSFLCKRMACRDDFSTRSKAGMFLISALSWLDMLRGFSGAEKLTYSTEVRECVRDHGSLSLHTLVGCPPVIFFKIGHVLEAGKEFLAGDLLLEDFERSLDGAEKFFRGWDPEQAVYPTAHPEWRQLAEAYRHACLLRVMRFPDAFAISCEDPRIKTSVAAVLDICATMPRDSVFYKRLLFPLFLAGADTCSPHQIHYASWCISEIKHSTGFEHPAMTEVLTKVWEARRDNPHGWSNIPWMEFTCSELLRSQHAYLFF